MYNWITLLYICRNEHNTVNQLYINQINFFLNVGLIDVGSKPFTPQDCFGYSGVFVIPYKF